MAVRIIASRTLMICVVGLLAACSQKAEMLKLSANQFGTATESAFDAYGTAQSLQFAPFPKSDDEKRSEFLTNMDTFTSTVTPSNIDVLVDRNARTTGGDGNAAWKATLTDLRSQYQQFISIFDNIEGGSALGASAVTKSGPILEKLRQQLAAITKNLTQNPPQYLSRRASLIAKLNAIRDDKSDGPDAKNLRYELWLQDWQALMVAEQELQSTTLRHFVSASKLGAKLHTQIDNYAKLDVASLIAAVEQGISLVDDINSLSPEELLSQSTALIETATN
jgi:hypothetical protein